MTIRDKHQALANKYHWLITPIGTLLLGYLGVGEYEKYEARQAAAPAAPITITVEASDSTAAALAAHPHPYAATIHGSHLTAAGIQAMIEKAVAGHQTSDQYHEFSQ
jgi:hypothetical protein